MEDGANRRRDPRRILGLAGEAAAESRLRKDGLEIVARGFRTRCGEIDLIARDGCVVVFVEVKTRTGEAFGRPAEAVTARKRRRIARVASLFLARSGWADRPCRFDVVEVVPVGTRWRVTRIADAFRSGD
jgi:putative endonuclease